MEKFKCCICGKEVDGWGNNPWPVVDDKDARCCDDCHARYIMPARLAMMSNDEKGE